MGPTWIYEQDMAFGFFPNSNLMCMFLCMLLCQTNGDVHHDLSVAMSRISKKDF